MHGIIVCWCVGDQWIAFITATNDLDQENKTEKPTDSAAHWVNHNK
jgi:hypothetical protein